VRALAESVVVVTGASSGIGEATVRRLLKAGAKVVLTARRSDRLTTLCAELDPSDRATLAVAADITSDPDRRRLVADTLAKFGRIDGLINNAGFGQRGPVEVVSVETIRQNFETNLFSLIALTQLVAPLMRAQGSGRIVNISSVAGRIARPLSSIYDSTKHALEAISDGLRGELAPFGVQVVVIRPGFIQTEFVQAANEASAQVLAQDGPYTPYLLNFPKNAQKMHRVAGRPDDIAQKVVRALTAVHPKTHYSAPQHAKVFLFVNWLLPRGWIDRLVRMKKATH
jgi:short-subunit dehydrogenase